MCTSLSPQFKSTMRLTVGPHLFVNSVIIRLLSIFIFIFCILVHTSERRVIQPPCCPSLKPSSSFLFLPFPIRLRLRQEACYSYGEHSSAVSGLFFTRFAHGTNC